LVGVCVIVEVVVDVTAGELVGEGVTSGVLVEVEVIVGVALLVGEGVTAGCVPSEIVGVTVGVDVFV